MLIDAKTRWRPVIFHWTIPGPAIVQWYVRVQHLGAISAGIPSTPTAAFWGARPNIIAQNVRQTCASFRASRSTTNDSHPLERTKGLATQAKAHRLPSPHWGISQRPAQYRWEKRKVQKKGSLFGQGDWENEWKSLM